MGRITNSHALPTLILLATSLVTSSICLGEDKVDFNRDVRPILSDRCFLCHGPDEQTRAADLRFDIAAEAQDSIESGEFIDRVFSADPDLVMPKPESHLELSDQEKKTLKTWVDQGAEYQQHWSFAPLPSSIAIPEFEDSRWPRQDLDRFVLRGLQQQKLAPSDEAPPLRWLRRVTFDLTGLPPTSDQIKSFQQQVAAPDADRETIYQHTVDGLLASESYGQHMAVAWLDAARYADSYGYQSDKLNTQWPYRDWVIKSFNQNQPYDQFLTWQLAGDLLEEPTTEQVLATAFNRIHRLNNEGGAVFEEWRIENVADRVHTYGSAILGLTFECCRCHDHKYDPISARDYYSMSAFFNSIDENGLYDRTAKVPSPTILLPSAEQTQTLQTNKLAIEKARQQLDAALKSVAEKFEAGDYSKQLESADVKTKLADEIYRVDLDVPYNDSFKELFKPSTNDRNWTTWPDLVEVEDCPFPRPGITADEKPPRKALPLDGERGFTTKTIAPFDRWTPFSAVINFRETKRVPQRSVIAHHTRGTDAGYNGWDLTIEDGHLESRMYRVWPGNGMGVRTIDPIPVDQWHLLVATYDGYDQVSGLKIFLDGKELPTQVLRDQRIKSANVLVDHGGEFVIGQRFRDRGLANGFVADVRVYQRALTMPEINHLTTGQPITPDASFVASVIDKDAIAASQQLNDAVKAFVGTQEKMNEVPIMAETETPRPAHILSRGEYDAETSDETLVTRSTPQHIGPPLVAGAQPDRLSLARWTTDPNHPLTARVITNRLWMNFFGHGLVRTPENFGLQGELPTHPRLLDFLSREFINDGWNVKDFCKRVALSATYRQQSATTPENLATDPENRILGRGPAHRLSAEQIRDLVLAASGLLNPTPGGPPVSPYQPGGDLWKESNSMSPAYEQSVGTALYRRSIFSVWKRTAPLPNMMAFDTSSREVCTIARSRTNTPLQALVLLNDVQFIEAARKLAEKVHPIKDQDARLDEAFLRLTGAHLNPEEAQVLSKLYDAELEYFRQNKDDAKAFLAIGSSPADDGVPAPELAALTTVCQAIMNLDSTVTKR
jgi:hypothetical protein